MNTRRNALTLAALLAATVLTGGAAILGLVHAPAQHVAQPAILQTAQPVQQATQNWEEGD